MYRKVIPLAVLALTISSGAAQAQAYPGERETRHPKIQRMVAKGVAYWQARGLQPCASPTIIGASDLTDVDAYDPNARAELNGCRIWVRADLLASALSERSSGARGGDSHREALCALIFHELGHTAGLEHSEGIMHATHRETPRGCVVPSRARRARQASTPPKPRRGTVVGAAGEASG